MSDADDNCRVILLSTSPDYIHRVRTSIGEIVRVVQSIEAVGIVSGLRLLIIAVETLTRSQTSTWMLWRHANPQVSIALITPSESANIRELKSLIVDEIIWDSEIETELKSYIDPLIRDPAMLVLRRFADHDATTEALKRAAEVIINSDPPVRTVARLSRKCHCSRSTLQRHWAKHPYTKGTLEQFVDWMSMIRALHEYHRLGHWKLTADAIGVRQETLRRRARKLMNAPLNNVADLSRQDIVDRMQRSVFLPPVQ